MTVIRYFKRECGAILRLIRSHFLLMKRTRVETFDVFDTCLTRKYAYPSDLFYDLAKGLAINQPNIFKYYPVETIASARHRAQAIAYNKHRNGDPNLEDIYNEFASIFPGTEKMVFINLEESLEETNIVPCHKALALVEEERKRNGRVIFASDMYLSEKFISKQLSMHGFLLPNDKVYVSCEQQTSKRKGDLYLKIASNEKLQLRSILHRGDNYKSDVIQALFAGLSACHMKGSRLNDKERKMFKNLTKISPVFASRIVGASRAIRVKNSSDNNNIDKFVGHFAGPFLWIYAEWIIKECTKEKINEIYLSSRDCLGLYSILEKLLKHKCLKIKLIYFQVSRSALVKSSLLHNGAFNGRYLKKVMAKKSVAEILCFLNIDSDKFMAKQKEIGSTNLDLMSSIRTDDSWECLFQVIRSLEEYEALTKEWMLEKQAAKAYFESIHLNSTKPKIIVDLIVRLNCSEIISSLLLEFFGSINVYSLFLGTQKKSTLSPLTINFKCVFSDVHDPSTTLSYLFSKATLLELFLSCDAVEPLQSYRSLSGKSCHLLSEETIKPELQMRKEFGSSMWRYVSEYVVSMDIDQGVARSLLISISNDFINKPQKSWLKLLEDVHHFDETLWVSSRKLAKPYSLSIKDFVSLTKSTNKHYFVSQVLLKRRWPQLAKANSSKLKYFSIFAIYLLIKLASDFKSCAALASSIRKNQKINNKPLFYRIYNSIKKDLERIKSNNL